jgi:hypothetical protein
LLEPHTPDSIERIGGEPASWFATASGLFSDAPHLCLVESQFRRSANAAVTRYFVIDAATAEVQRYSGTLQGYSAAEYEALLAECGFSEIASFPSLTGTTDPDMPDLFALRATAG